MQLKFLFLLLTTFALIDLGKTSKYKVIAALCRLARNNTLWLPIANRRCITGCLGDPDNYPIIVFNQCEPFLEPGAKEEMYYNDGFCKNINRDLKENESFKKLNWNIDCDDTGLLSKGLVLLYYRCEK